MVLKRSLYSINCDGSLNNLNVNKKLTSIENSQLLRGNPKKVKYTVYSSFLLFTFSKSKFDGELIF